MNTTTPPLTCDVRTEDTTELENLAGVLAQEISLREVPRQAGMDLLHEVALELNRRRTAASEQGPELLSNAVDMLYMVAAPFEEERTTVTAFVRALGLVLDRADELAVQTWESLQRTGWTRENIRVTLENLAYREGWADYGAVRVAGPFFPADAIPPF